MNGLLRTSKSGKILYAIAYMYTPRPGTWKGEFLYLHADDAGDARLQFFRSEDPEMLRMRNVVVTGVAPVIGYLVNDKHGEDLSV